ncbi:MAG TPA: transglycosylase SLT domain-containing protein [Asticcacaulis sp.]|nr:transglycosylase SLT domain-containing protein [Asticcacaulis sp.]
MPTYGPGAQTFLDGLGRAFQTQAPGVLGSLQRASAATGVDFSYLVKTAQRESSLNPNARARTSSATGLFQFIDQTWLRVVKASGAKHGYGAYADQIVKGRDGRFTVADPDMRRQVMGLRYNPDANAVMAAEMTAGHAAYLKGRIGRDPTQGELYAAHFLGPDGAADLITANASRPGAQAAALFPAAARSNPSIFYHHGQPLSVAEVVANLTHTGGDMPVVVQAADTAQDTPDNRHAFIKARLDKLRSDEMIMQMVFGGNGQQGMLFNTQLLGAFGPGDDEGQGQSKDAAALTKAFGGGSIG